MKTSIAATAAVVVLVNACSTIDDPQHPFSQGWRTGEIQMLGSSRAPFPPGAIDCRDPQIAKTQSNPTYAYVQFEFRAAGKYFGSNPKQRHIIAHITPGSRLIKGQRVRVNIEDCRRPIVLRNSSS